MKCLDSARGLSWASLLVLILLPMVSEAWWNDDWSFRKRIDLNDGWSLPAAAMTSDIAVPVRLHAGNFAYFMDLLPDAADLRFIAADGLTPLTYHVERFDPAAGIAIVWVRLPRNDTLAPPPDHFWMYYGNARAAPVQDAAATFDPLQTLVFSFRETGGLPQDSTAFGHHAEQVTGTLPAPGLLGQGLLMEGEGSIVLPSTPALTLGADSGLTFTTWIKLVDAAPTQQAVVFQQTDGESLLELGLAAGLPYLRLASAGEEPVMLDSGITLTPERWHYLALTAGDGRVRLYVDGHLVQERDTALPDLAVAGNVIGSARGLAGFRGTVDELRIWRLAQPPETLRLLFESQRPEGTFLVLGQDESRRTASRIAAYLTLLSGLLGEVGLDGWAVIILILILGALSADVIIAKSITLGRAESADDAFLVNFRQRELQTGITGAASAGAAAVTGPETPGAVDHSPLNRLYQAGLEELRWLLQAADERGASRRLGAEGIEVLRSSLDATMIDEIGRLNSRMVLITIAVTGGPFLGLLGTVIGVMMTFAAIAATGDVNVSSIAPGVAAALTTTVAGLLIAIPSLFGYNYIAGRIARRTAAMEVFSDRLVSRLAIAHSMQGEQRAAP